MSKRMMYTREEMARKTALAKIIRAAGSQAEVARALGVTQQSVNGWVRTGRVPAGRVLALIGIAGEGRPEDLRPDVFGQ